MINIQEIVRQLAGNTEAVRALAQGISDEQAQWKPRPDAWSMKQVMEHLYNEERLDFRKHLKEMLADPPQPWDKGRREDTVAADTCRQALEGFLSEREASIAWLKALEALNWEMASQTPFGPAGNPLVLKAGDVLLSWVAHDFLHLRQMIELRYAWLEKEAAPYSLQYAGGW